MKVLYWAIAWIVIVETYVRIFEPTVTTAFFIGMLTGGCIAGAVQGIHSSLRRGD